MPSFMRKFATSRCPWGVVAFVLLSGLLLAQNALAVQASGAVSILPSDNTLDPAQIFSAVIRVSNASSETGAEGTATVPAELSGTITVTLACEGSTCLPFPTQQEIPGTLAFVPAGGNNCLASVAGVANCAASGLNAVLITIGTPIVLPAGGSVDIATIQLQAVNPVLNPASGSFFQRAATGPDDISAESVVNPQGAVTGGGEGSTRYFFPGFCDVRVDKQISCDGGVTWVDQSLVNANEDGTNGCMGLPNDQILVRYQVSNVGNMDAAQCVLTETNGAFGDPIDPGSIPAGSTSAFITGALTPLCSASQGNEPNTATVTCNTCGGIAQAGSPLLTASDMATFACLSVDLKTDRAVSCVGGDPAGFNDQTLVQANEDGTNGPTAVNGQNCSWQYQANNPGTAPLYDCVLTDSNASVTPTPIVVDNLAPGALVQIPATNSVACSDTLETAETPGGRVDLACCTRDVAALVDCATEDRVQVFDLSTVTCNAPDFNVDKLCEVNRDTNDATFTVTVQNTGQVALENCVATDNLSPDGLCDNTGNPIPQVLDPAAPFALALGGSQVLTGGATITADSCNNVSVKCTVVGTGEEITRSDNASCPFTPPQEGCLTRTPGFWGTHPHITALYLDLEVCGTTIDNVTAGNDHSAIEAMCSVGTDSKSTNGGPALGPQRVQLVRQCMAASLNVAASRALEGNCNADIPGTNALLEGCCGSDSICTGDDVPGLSVNECIQRLDAFNNTDPDTLNFPFNTGPADSSACRDSKNNGVVVRPTP